ncbi:alpha/beta-hydrolase [Xylona heveae TC161]|uniref:Alpha/beta-hydrolase n=1 Tax=Xylona heveae (strain CBS 132557 / TC161) TaxID=1328760 RepID=A0A165ACV0_XYLHT|nr:alpha/beta-hydrolase [Xylona heveae TC161]KZF20267.1 alpha/beta-hydrolase [Xylona heveae TC161]
MSPVKVNFPSNGIKVVGDLYFPPPGAPDQKRAAIVVSHPGGGVKEQTAGLYARLLSEKGFITLAFDAAFQGESEGEPRGLENPQQRAEDVRSAVTYLTTRDDVDPERIGALGICASGAYVPFAAQTDQRIKAVATLSAVDFGALVREGLQNTAGVVSKENLVGTLTAAGRLRTAEAKGEAPVHGPLVSDDPNTIPDGTPTLFREGSEYYRTPRGQHPRAPNRMLARSVDLLANFSAYTFNDLISPRPLLMIVGSLAESKYFSELAIERAKEPKELYIVDGKTHVDLYDDASEALPKFADFFQKTVGA